MPLQHRCCSSIASLNLVGEDPNPFLGFDRRFNQSTEQGTWQKKISLMADIAVFIESENASSERRISLTWSVEVLKSKLYIITGIPPDYQKLSCRYDSEDQLVSSIHIEPLSTIKVADTRPAGQRPNLSDPSKVDKFELSKEEYESRSDSVLAFKKRNQIGRFDPQQRDKDSATFEDAFRQGIVDGQRCRIGEESDRRGTIRYLGLVPEIPAGGIWVGVEYDEPVGKNDGSIAGRRYFTSGDKFGGFIRPVRVEVGDYPVKSLDDDIGASDEDEL